jgi:hypothetical protein
MNRKRAFTCRLSIEPLEDRCLLSGGAIDLAIGGRALAQHSILQTADPVTSAQVSQAYGQLPLSFEANQGQVDSQVNFLSRGAGYGLFLTPTEAVMALQQGSAGDLLRMQVVGANPTAQAVGLDEQAGRSNYLIGNDPSQWHTDVPNFGRVAYCDVYPGINLLYYGNQRQLEYDFVVAPGADPRAIALRFDGAERLTLDGQGNLVVHTTGGETIQHAPVLYQEIQGSRTPVSGAYVLQGQDQVDFQVGTYDPTKPLVIDPVFSLVYSTYLGGRAFAIALDSAGNAYVTGMTGSALPTLNPFQSKNAGGLDVFVTKLNAAGSGLIYSTYLGGSGDDVGYGIAVDSAGNALVTGLIQSTNFPTVHAFQPTFSGSFSDAFVAKLNGAGSGLIYSTYLGGSFGAGDYGDQIGGIAVDLAGNAYVTGETDSADFPTTAGAFQTRYPGGVPNGFVTKFNPTGSVVYSTYLGGTGGDRAYAIAVDGAGNAYVTGHTSSPDFPTTPGAYQTTGQVGAFVTKLNVTGSALVYSTRLVGADDFTIGLGIAVDGSGNAYVTGHTESASFPTVNAFQTALLGSGDAFVTKFNATGSALLYSTFLGGSNGDEDGRGTDECGIAVDGSGTAYVTGFTSANNFPTKNAFQATFGGPGTDAFVARFDTNQVGNSSLIYSSVLGGSNNDKGAGIAIDANGNAYVAGSTDSNDFPTTRGAFQSHRKAGLTAFVTKIDPPQELGGAVLDRALTVVATGLGQRQVLPGHGIDAVRSPTRNERSSPTRRSQAPAADRPGLPLGLASGHPLWLDANAAGWGWFVDKTPWDDSEFTTPGNQGEQNRMDLLTVLEPEMGPLLGKEHEAAGVLPEALAPGIRVVPGGDHDWLGIVDRLFVDDLFTGKKH